MERIWIYQSDRELSETEVGLANNKLQEFAAQWKAHGKELAARAEIRYNRFIILFLNESVEAASGCSIDSSVRFLKAIENELGVNLFDRMQTAYFDGDQVKAASRTELEALLSAGEINQDTLVFDNTVQSSEELAKRWIVPIKDSWQGRMFNIS
ncbi:ABC transporter ATPase [Albibacterium indicum]|uniref:ABC transporter ATPase n=1 Tax=Albibacterium indicum TaxID=2292082 RepID=UPI000E54E876|nr:ABC transporter ATPase [Pedobacter indicus]